MPESNRQRTLVEFAGAVTCARSAPEALTLCGTAIDAPGERLILTFLGIPDGEVPATVTSARVSSAGGQTYQLEGPTQRWTIRARALHVHRDVRVAFFQAVPPRRVPLGKRLFWRAVLRLAAHRSAVRVLVALRGR